jgi:hypothetical protein
VHVPSVRFSCFVRYFGRIQSLLYAIMHDRHSLYALFCFLELTIELITILSIFSRFFADERGKNSPLTASQIVVVSF